MKRETAPVAEMSLQRALRELCVRYPYHAPWLSLEQFRRLPGFGTMAVMRRDGMIQYAYDPKFVAKCSGDELLGVLHHEVNHILFGHVDTDQAAYPNRNARMIAEEVTVNEWVPERLPGDPLTLASFPYLPPLEDTHTRYERLASRTDLPNVVPLLDNHAVWNMDENGEPVPTDLASLHQALDQLTPERRAVLEQVYGRRLRDWDASSIGVELLRRTMPSKSCVNWEHLLHSCLPTSVQRHPNYHRPPRRFPELTGIVPAESMQMIRPRVMAVIDTSGSMKTPTLERISSELKRIGFHGEVTIVECDKLIQATYPMKGPLQKVRGRGGTDFRPPLDAKFLAKHRPDIVVYFTDGDGPAPQRPPAVPLVWCLTKGGKLPAKWGRIIRIS